MAEDADRLVRTPAARTGARGPPPRATNRREPRQLDRIEMGVDLGRAPAPARQPAAARRSRAPVKPQAVSRSVSRGSIRFQGGTSTGGQVAPKASTERRATGAQTRRRRSARSRPPSSIVLLARGRRGWHARSRAAGPWPGRWPRSARGPAAPASAGTTASASGTALPPASSSRRSSAGGRGPASSSRHQSADRLAAGGAGVEGRLELPPAGHPAGSAAAGRAARAAISRAVVAAPSRSSAGRRARGRLTDPIDRAGPGCSASTPSRRTVSASPRPRQPCRARIRCSVSSRLERAREPSACRRREPPRPCCSPPGRPRHGTAPTGLEIRRDGARASIPGGSSARSRSSGPRRSSPPAISRQGASRCAERARAPSAAASSARRPAPPPAETSTSSPAASIGSAPAATT